MSYPPGQQPPTWGGRQQPPTWNQPPPTWGPQPAGGPGPGWGPPHYSVTPGASGASPLAIVAAFIGILVLLVVGAAVIILLSQPPAPEPPCVPGRPCAPGPSLPPIAAATPATPVGQSPIPSAVQPSPQTTATPTQVPASPGPIETPASTSPPVVLGGSTWRSATLGYGFEFNDERFSVSQSTDTLAVLEMRFFDATVVVEATTADVSPAELIGRELAVVDGFMIGRTKDTDDYDAVLGPSIGYISGETEVYSGILTISDGTPAAPGGVTVMASTNGRLTVAVVLIVSEPDSLFGSDTAQYIVRTAVDDIVKTFDWGAPP